MLHELKSIINFAKEARQQQLKTALATVVALDGSSYRRPGVRMGICEDNRMVGAVSGGCVEKEVLQQAQSVFKDGLPKLMVYDGRYRLGCEGILYILIESFRPESTFFEAFKKQYASRTSFSIHTQFSKQEEGRHIGGSVFEFSDGSDFTLGPARSTMLIPEVFTQVVTPAFKLIIIGAEHDAVQLCHFASSTGWEVHIVAPPDDPKSIDHFPGATAYHGIDEHTFKQTNIDDQTAVMLMTHSFVKDLKYLTALIDKTPAYLGLLGPQKRREQLFAQLLEQQPELSEDFLEHIHGPSGIDIGAETAQEIAISIIAEILTVIRNVQPMLLRDKKEGIHQ